MDEEPPKRRRTNFDITPEELEEQPFASSSGVASAVAAAAAARVAALCSSFSTNYQVANDVLYVSVTEASFLAKLEKAMQKNFDYIDRKDLLAAEALLRGEIYVEQAKAPKPKFSSLYGKHSFQQAKPGIGSSVAVDTSKQPVSSKAESASIYVSGLPKDITEEELEILFSPQGKIKKIKLYVDDKGSKKGDALISFANPDSATAACFKLHRLNIGEGHILNVTKADFSGKQAKENNSNNQPNTPADDGLGNLSDDTIRQQLPVECEANLYPVIIFWHAFNPVLEDANEVETEYLLACCPHGNVRVIQLHPLSSLTNTINPPSPEHSIIVTFELAEGAKKCLTALQGQSILNKPVQPRLLLPRNMIPSSNALENQSSEHETIPKMALTTTAGVAAVADAEGQLVQPKPIDDVMLHEARETILHHPPEEVEGSYDEAKIQEEVDNVEDFLNSLL